jgi:20S proteasome alpha/beta subunit
VYLRIIKVTVLVGIHCKDGVVIGADSSATSSMGQYPLIEQTTKKIDLIEEKIIVAGTGQVGLGQRFKYIVESCNKNAAFEKQHHIDVGKRLSQAAIQDFASTNATKSQFGALVAFCSKNKPHLCELSITDFQPEF